MGRLITYSVTSYNQLGILRLRAYAKHALRGFGSLPKGRLRQASHCRLGTGLATHPLQPHEPILHRHPSPPTRSTFRSSPFQQKQELETSVVSIYSSFLFGVFRRPWPVMQISILRLLSVSTDHLPPNIHLLAFFGSFFGSCLSVWECSQRSALGVQSGGGNGGGR